MHVSHLDLHDLDSFYAALARHARVLLFKHSPICPVSAAALQEWERFRAGQPSAATLQVDVVAERTLSRAIAAACGVAHESPQAILFAGGRASWHASHGAITTTALAAAWARRG